MGRPTRTVVIPLVAVVAVAATLSIALAANAGDRDRGFGDRGRVETDFGNRDGAVDVAIGTAGAIVVVGDTYGTSSFRHGDIARYRPNGHLDRRFSDDGKLRVPYFLGAVAIQTRYRFVVGGSSGSDLIVARYQFDGTLDRSFGTDGVATVTGAGGALDIVVLPNNSLVVVTGAGIWKLRSGGTLDAGFGTDGEAPAPVGQLYSAAIQPDGRIVAAGSSGTGLHLRAMRFRTGGKLDTSFSHDGVSKAVDVTSTAPWVGVGIQSSGGIVVAGATTVVRFTTSGTIDRAFGRNGLAPGSFLDRVNDDDFGLLIQSDDRIVVVGQTHTDAKPVVFAVARLSAGGSRDRSFSGDGVVTTAFPQRYAGARGAALDPVGRILAVGAAGPPGVLGDFALVRYLA